MSNCYTASARLAAAAAAGAERTRTASGPTEAALGQR